MIGTVITKRAMGKMPRLNPELCEGLAYRQSSQIEQYVHEVLMCASASFPPGLRYTGNYRRATPEQQLSEQTRLKRAKRLHEVAYSDLYYCIYDFEFNGERLNPRYMQLPYIRRGGIVRVRGSSFVVSPVLADNIFSVESDKIYMPVTRSKLTFQKLSARFLANGQSVPADVVHSKIFILRRGEAASKRESVLFHYILAKVGLTRAFHDFFHTNVVVGDETTITPEAYPESDWVICSSRGVRPPGKLTGHYAPSILRVAVPAPEFTADVATAMASLFYIVDYEPYLTTADYVDNPLLWRRILPQFIKAEEQPVKKAMEEMEAHIASVDSYIDDLVRRKLVHEGVPCESTYHLFAYMMKQFSELTLRCDPADVHNKQLETVRPLLYDVVYSISNLMFDLVKLTGDRLTRENIERTFDQKFPTNAIQAINRRHGEVSTLESATDCLPFSVTKGIVPQTKASDRKGSSKSKEMRDPSFALHASQCTVNTYLFITKSAPSARESINHFLQLTPTDEVYVDPVLRKELDALQKMIKPE